MTQNDTTTGFPKGLRDTQNWYVHADPLAIVDNSIVNFILAHGGQTLLDLGCGTGGYSKLIAAQGRSVQALDINEQYVAAARRLGVNAGHYDGSHIPLPDKSVDTIFMVEVLEHIVTPAPLLAELKRVARRNVIITVPNCTQEFNSQVVFHHMLDIDHKNFFTMQSLQDLLASQFQSVDITQVAAIDSMLAKEFLPRWLFRIWRLAHKYRVIKDRYFFRLIAHIKIDPMSRQQ